MPRVLVIGYAPHEVDFSDPVVPKGLTPEIIAVGLARDLKTMHAIGWDAEHLPIRAEAGMGRRIMDHLAKYSYDCIVIGSGVRMTTRHIAEFEEVIAAVRVGAPRTPIAFNASPDSSAEAASRWLQKI